MKFEEAKILREKWNGDPCNHPTMELEFFMGTMTGDYLCTNRGHSFDEKEVKLMKELGSDVIDVRETL